jgi:hypothetical protein
VAEYAPVIGSEVLATPTAITKLIVATVPFAMIPAFEPDTKQVYVPAVPEQFNALDALVDAVPATAEIDTTLVVG